MKDFRQIILNFIRDTGANLFITGKAGTGKTTLLQEIRATSDPTPVVVAYTAAAALNAGGVTISSFFQMPRGPIIPDGLDDIQPSRFAPEKLRLLRALQLLIIDEISMVRADMLDYLDRLLQEIRLSNEPFGGVQVLAFGDLYQLPPVTNSDWSLLATYYDSPYFFSSRIYRNYPFQCFELEHVFRQKDPVFIDILNSIRQNNISDDLLTRLNERYLEGKAPEDHVTLTTHNRLVSEINNQRLEALPGDAITYEAVVTGEYPREAFPGDEKLVLKKDAMVIMTKNDTSGKHQYYNGRAALVTDLSTNYISVRFLDEGTPFEILPEVWVHMTYTLSEGQDKVRAAEAGTFTQYPVKLAWAITVHKSQGLTFDKVVVDVSASFAHGQAYVALSRCRSLFGLVLNAPVDRSSLITDPAVVAFMKNLRRQQGSAEETARASNQRLHIWVRSQFTYPRLFREQGRFSERLEGEDRAILEEVLKNAVRFRDKELSSGTIARFQENPNLLTRLQAAAGYFLPRLERLTERLIVIIDRMANEKPSGIWTAEAELLLTELSLRYTFFKHVLANDSLENSREALVKSLPAMYPQQKKRATKETILLHPELHKKLCDWRSEWSRQKSVPEHIVMAEKALIAISNKAPRSIDDLASVGGVGPAKARSMGESLLKVINEHFGAQELF